MEIGKTDIIGKIRTAIDDIVMSTITMDTFKDDVDKELWQATWHAAIELSRELPINMLDATVKPLTGTYDSARGFAYGELPEEYLRFVSIDIHDTAGILTELIEPGSDMEKMQRSPWSRGTATKPKAMLDHDENGNKVIVWWPGDKTHNSALLTYVAVPTWGTPDEEPSGTEPAGTEAETAEETSDSEQEGISCAIREDAERLVIYRAASIFFEGKKEETIAEKFRTMSTNY